MIVIIPYIILSYVFIPHPTIMACMSTGEEKDSTTETSTTVPNRYTVRVYRSSPQTSGDRVTIVGISLYGRLYSKVNNYTVMISCYLNLALYIYNSNS